MEIQLARISYQTDQYELKAAFAKILHSDVFRRDQDDDEALLNFHIALGEHENGTLRHNGKGVLTVPTRTVGKKLLEMMSAMPTEERKLILRDIILRDTHNRPSKGLLQTVLKVRYQDPKVVKERDDIVQKMNVYWRVTDLQFGQWLKKPEEKKSQLGIEVPGIFAWEWSKNYTNVGVARLSIEYEHKVIRLTLGDPLVEEEAYSVVIKFTNIQNIWHGYEHCPFICFDLYTPAIFETENFNRSTTGVVTMDQKKFRRRISAIDEAHRLVSPYAYQIRITLFQCTDSDLEEFAELCNLAELRKPRNASITSESHCYVSRKKLLLVQKQWQKLESVPWTVRFQIDNMLRQGLITTDVFLQQLVNPLIELTKTRRHDAGTVVRDYAQRLAMESIDMSRDFAAHFKRFCSDYSSYSQSVGQIIRDDHIFCHSVTVTPTRYLLEGPYASQSNRIVRQFVGYQDHFLRVDFRDEDRLQYRWDREVDGNKIIDERVGRTLKEGLEIAGRKFEFLGYSSSALRDHSTWFINPFFHPEKKHVTAASIRKEAGDFTKLLHTPAKYAARLSQALSATAPSVKIDKSQWCMMDDIGMHTDGVGTFSKELGSKIWEEMRKKNPGLSKKQEPGAYQIRFLGFKGVISLDSSLMGVKMQLRESMKKFDVHDVQSAEIEIANAFHTPSPMHLHRSMVMILEDLGVKLDVFLDLLDDAIGDARVACDDVNELVRVLKKHKLGHCFGFDSTLQRLAGPSFQLHLDPTVPETCLRSPFMDSLIQCAVGNIYRELQYRCRIPVPKSWHLVGVADEGPAWIERGVYEKKDMCLLKYGEIFGKVCVQKDKNSEPEYLEGQCLVSRSPMYYPGDAQMVHAIGKPPAKKLCAFRDLVNVVVFPSQGMEDKSFVSQLSGGDLDGDTYDVSRYDPIFYALVPQTGTFPAVEMLEIDSNLLKVRDPVTGKMRLDQEKAIPFVCDFIVDYMKSDVLGMLADNHLIRADQATDGVRDEGCITIAGLANEAVDYPRNGRPVDINRMPRRLFRENPDWKQGEVDTFGKKDFYRSDRAVGHIFRETERICDPAQIVDGTRTPEPKKAMENPIFLAVDPIVQAGISGIQNCPRTTKEQVLEVFRPFESELKYICTTHALSAHQRLTEAEVVIGTILARCSQHRLRKERIYKMELHARNLEVSVKEAVCGKKWDDMETKDLKRALEFAWTAWKMTTDSIASNKMPFTQSSFALIMLSLTLDCLERLEILPNVE